MLSAFPSSVFYTELTISELKVNKYSIQKETEIGLPVLEFSTKISKFYAPQILNTNFIKWE